MGYWISYLGVGYGASCGRTSGAAACCCSRCRSFAGCSCRRSRWPGFAWTRALALRAVLPALALVGLIVMTAGFPEGTPLRRASKFTYNHSASAVPAHDVQGGAAAGARARRCWPGASRAAAPRARRLARRRAALGVALAARARPRRRRPAAVERSRRRGRPRPTTSTRPPATGARSCCPASCTRTTTGAARSTRSCRRSRQAGRDALAVPYADLRATELLWTVDALVQQRARAGPAGPAAGPARRRRGHRRRRRRSRAQRRRAAADAAGVLDSGRRRTRPWGALQRAPAAAGTLGQRPRAAARSRLGPPGRAGLVRVAPDGRRRSSTAPPRGSARWPRSARCAPALALRRRSGDRRRSRRARREVVVADSNRRRVFVASRLARTRRRCSPREDPSEDAAISNPFPARGTDEQTVAVYDGVARVRAPFSPGFPQFPEHRPFAALDGDPTCGWPTASSSRPATGSRSGSTAPRDVADVEAAAASDRAPRSTAVRSRPPVRRRPGWNRLALGLHDAGRCACGSRTCGAERRDRRRGGIRELARPACGRARRCAPPVVVERRSPAARAAADLPVRAHDGRRAVPRGRGGARRRRARARPRRRRARPRARFAPPAARTSGVHGWTSVAPTRPDERSTGSPARAAAFAPRRASRAARLARLERVRRRPPRRGSARGWTAAPPWMEWSDASGDDVATPADRAGACAYARRRCVRLRRRRATPPSRSRRRPSRCRGPSRGRAFRLEILDAAFPPGTPGATVSAAPSGSASCAAPACRGRGPRGGDPRGCVARGASAAGRCAAAVGTIADLDAGRRCAARLRAGSRCPRRDATAPPPAARAVPAAAALRGRGAAAGAGPGRVVEAGCAGARQAGRRPARRSTGPSRLVLGEASTAAGARSATAGARRAPVDGYANGWRVPRMPRVPSRVGAGPGGDRGLRDLGPRAAGAARAARSGARRRGRGRRRRRAGAGRRRTAGRARRAVAAACSRPRSGSCSPLARRGVHRPASS